MLRSIHDPDRGATMVEYCAVLVLAAAVLGSLLSSGLLGSIRTGTASAVEALLGTGTPPEASGPDAGPAGPGQGAPPQAEPGGNGGGTGNGGSGGNGGGGGDPASSGNGGQGGSGRTIKGGPRTPETGAGWSAEFLSTIGIQFEESAKDFAAGVVDESTEASAGLGKYLANKAGGMRDGMVNTLNSWQQDADGNSLESAKETIGVREKYGDLAAGGYSLYATQRDMWWKNEASPGGFARRGAAGLLDDEFWKAAERSETGAEPAAILAYNGLGYINPLEAKGKWLDLLGTPGSVKPGRPDPKPDPRADGGGGPGATAPPGKGREDEDREDEDRDGEPDAPSCPRPKNSFVPGTPVLLADGSTEPIEDIEVGDEVHAFDPRTGEEGPRPVTDLIRGTGKKTLVDITVINDNGTKGTVTATAEHPFWLPDHAEWADAINLKEGSRLRTSTGSWAQVSAVETSSATQQSVHNLTVSDLHTYYVLAGSSALLSHNSNKNKGVPPVSGCNGSYAPNPKHKAEKRGNISAEPKDGQKALDNSIPIGPNTTRRVAADKENGEFVVLDETHPGEGKYHGHAVSWDELRQSHKNALLKAGLVTRKGKFKN